MKILILGIGALVILGIVALYVGAKRYVASEAAKDSAAIAEFRSHVNEREEFLPPIADPETEDEITPETEPEEEPHPLTLDEWLGLNERDRLRAELHELREELDRVQKRFRHGLWAITEGTVEWSQEWEDELNAMLAQKVLVNA